MSLAAWLGESEAAASAKATTTAAVRGGVLEHSVWSKRETAAAIRARAVATAVARRALLAEGSRARAVRRFGSDDDGGDEAEAALRAGGTLVLARNTVRRARARTRREMGAARV